MNTLAYYTAIMQFPDTWMKLECHADWNWSKGEVKQIQNYFSHR